MIKTQSTLKQTFNEAELLIEVARTINHMDTSFLNDLIADDFEFISTPSALGNFKSGALRFYQIIEDEFSSVIGNPNSRYPSAEFCYFTGIVNPPRGFLKVKLNKRLLILTIVIENGKIRQIKIFQFDRRVSRVELAYFPY